MNTTAIRLMARRLIAWEAGPDGWTGTARVCDKLRVPLARLAGVAGFRSLMSRALALAAAESPVLKSVRLGADGALERLVVVAESDANDAGVVLVAQLLGLLVTFIGEPLTMRLVCDAWPEAPLEDASRQEEGQP